MSVGRLAVMAMLGLPLAACGSAARTTVTVTSPATTPATTASARPSSTAQTATTAGNGQPWLTLHASYTDQRRYQYGFTIQVQRSLAPFIQWNPGDPGIERVWISNQSGPPARLTVQNQTPERDAPFADVGLDGPGLTLLYEIGKEVTDHAQALTRPSNSSNPIYIELDFNFANSSVGPTTIPNGATVTFDPFLGSAAEPNIVAGSSQLAERDEATVTAILSRPPAYIVFEGSSNYGGWLGNESPGPDDPASNCLVANGDVAVIGGWHGDGTPASCHELNAAYNQIL